MTRNTRRFNINLQVAIVVTLALANGTSFAFAQTSKIQQLGGTYEGLTKLPTELTPIDLTLDVISQESRSFEATVTVDGNPPVSVSGTIAASDQCSIVSEPGGLKSNLSLTWRSFGDGAGLLLGKLSIGKVSGPVAIVRPFDFPGVDWTSRQGTHLAVLTSQVTGRQSAVEASITSFGPGQIEIQFDGWTDPEPQPVVIGSSGMNLGIVAAGVDAAGIAAKSTFSFAGRVTVDARTGVPTGITGTYWVTDLNGQTTDTGIIVILIG
jgi:hypothetical protein